MRERSERAENGESLTLLFTIVFVAVVVVVCVCVCVRTRVRVCERGCFCVLMATNHV